MTQIAAVIGAITKSGYWKEWVINNWWLFCNLFFENGRKYRTLLSDFFFKILFHANSESSTFWKSNFGNLFPTLRLVFHRDTDNVVLRAWHKPVLIKFLIFLKRVVDGPCTVDTCTSCGSIVSHRLLVQAKYMIKCVWSSLA